MRTLICTAAVAAGLVGCGDVDRFDVPIDGTVQLPGNPLGSVPFADELPLNGITDQNFSKAFSDHGVSAGDVESVQLKSMTIEVEAPAGGNLDFVDGLEFFVEAEGREPRRIAARVPMPKGASKVELETSGVELKPYISAGGMLIQAMFEGTQPQQDTTLRVRGVFEVDAGVL